MATKNSKIAKQAQQACDKWRNYFADNIDSYHENFDFILGEQWSDKECATMQELSKVPMQFNKLRTLANSLLGEQQQNTPQLNVVPMDNCDEQTAQVRELIIKDIMFNSRTKQVYQQAAKQAAIGGFGAFAVLTEYAHEKSFDVDPIYQFFKDATLCYWDVSAEHIDKTDGLHCGYITSMSRTKFRAKYSKKVEESILSDASSVAATSERGYSTTGNSIDIKWASDDAITINNYFVKTFEKDTLYKLSNGKIVDQKELDDIVEMSVMISNEMLEPELEAQEEQEQQTLDTIPLYDENELVRIENKREIKRAKVKHYVIAGEYVLDSSDFPSERLPIIFVDQDSHYNKEGKQVTASFLKDAKDAQRYINYLGTQSAYMLKISRYDQYMGSKKNVASKDTQQKWKNPLNVQGILTYDESPSGAKPEPLRPPELSQSLLTQYQRAIEDLYTSTGLYPTRLGQQGNETSGAAIDARTRQGSYPTYVYFNSINQAITSGGAVLNEMIPKVYDSERVFNLMTPDGQQQIAVNKQVDDYGEVIENDLSKGTFEVKLQAGASYEGQKEQAIQSFNAVLQANPQAFNLIADLYAENLPLTNTIEIKNRLKTVVPPEIIEAGKTGKTPEPKQQPPSPQEQAAMLEQQRKMQEIQIKQKELELEQQKQQQEMAIAQQKLEMERMEVLGKLQGEELKVAAEMDRTKANEQIAHADNITKILTDGLKHYQQ